MNLKRTDFANPFAAPGNWYKGSLHSHSTISDGELAPTEVLQWYRDHDYHFVALTDHDYVSEAKSIIDDFIALSGAEIGGTDPQVGRYHLVVLGLPSSGPLKLDGMTESIQDAVDRLQAAGGLVFLAHPYWSGLMSRDLLSLENCMGQEIFNGSCEVFCGNGLATVHWDDLLASGRRPWGLAVDDSHWPGNSIDAGLGWVWVKSTALNQDSILLALKQGHFYSSSGPKIHDLRLDPVNGEISVRCSPATTIDFVGNYLNSRRFRASPGETLIEASYRVKNRQSFVRVACQDTAGRWVWSNPIFFDW